MPRDADDHGWQESQRREHHGSARTRRHQDRPDHDGDGEGQQHLKDLPLVIPCHDGQESAGHDNADGIERPQAPPRASGAAGQEPKQAHRPAGSEVAERDRPLHHADERGAADQHHACEEEEVESERHEEERLADQRQALPHEIQPVRGVESPFEEGASPGQSSYHLCTDRRSMTARLTADV